MGTREGIKELTMQTSKLQQEFTASRLLNYFIFHFPELTKELKETTHDVNGFPNKFHLESSIWTHSLLVMQQAEKYESKVLLITALLHDLGKCRTKEFTTKQGILTSTFKGHEGLSSFMAVEVLNKLYNDEIVNSEEKITIFQLINLHGVVYDHIENGKAVRKGKLISQFGENYYLYSSLLKQVNSDTSGRFSSQPKTEGIIGKNIFNKWDFYANKVEPKVLNNELSTLPTLPTLTLLIGPPLSGKSTWVQHTTDECIISRDSTLLEYAHESLGKEIKYSDVFKLLTKIDQQNIDKILFSKFTNAVKGKKNIVIDMTNMSRNSRKKNG